MPPGVRPVSTFSLTSNTSWNRHRLEGTLTARKEIERTARKGRRKGTDLDKKIMTRHKTLKNIGWKTNFYHTVCRRSRISVKILQI